MGELRGEGRGQGDKMKIREVGGNWEGGLAKRG